MNPDEDLQDAKQAFDEWVQKWSAGRIGALGDHTDPSDVEFIMKRWVMELTEQANERGLAVGLDEAARTYGSVAEYVRYLYEIAERRARDNK